MHTERSITYAPPSLPKDMGLALHLKRLAMHVYACVCRLLCMCMPPLLERLSLDGLHVYAVACYVRLCLCLRCSIERKRCADLGPSAPLRLGACAALYAMRSSHAKSPPSQALAMDETYQAVGKQAPCLSFIQDPSKNVMPGSYGSRHTLGAAHVVAGSVSCPSWHSLAPQSLSLKNKSGMPCGKGHSQQSGSDESSSLTDRDYSISRHHNLTVFSSSSSHFICLPYY
jgi:hypothetical protein